MKDPIPSVENGGWKSQIPNAVTTIRLICAICILVWPRNIVFVFWLALAGGLSDMVDGFLAKRYGWATRFGERYDQWVDWLFGIALLYALYLKEDVMWREWPYNGELLFLIGMYLLIRTFIPLVDTTRIAKWKTGMQFAGAVVILGGHAWSFGTIITIGYMLVWSSIGVMMFTLVDYIKTARSR